MAHILIIDDDSSVLHLFGQFLEENGYSVALAANGKEGLSMMHQQRPDLIITDIMMPEMDGLEVIHEVRMQHPDLPVIAISGGMRIRPMNFLPHAKKMGACHVLGKPVELGVLLATVQEVLNGLVPALQS